MPDGKMIEKTWRNRSCRSRGIATAPVRITNGWRAPYSNIAQAKNATPAIKKPSTGIAATNTAIATSSNPDLASSDAKLIGAAVGARIIAIAACTTMDTDRIPIAAATSQGMKVGPGVFGKVLSGIDPISDA